MSKYAGTKQEKNLWDAFAGESQARNKYTYYASAAKKAGYEQLAALYLETADQEKNTQRCGSKRFMVSMILPRTWKMQQQVKL